MIVMDHQFRELEQVSSLKLFCEEAEKVDGKLFLYGAGIMLYDALPCMEQCGLRISAILDADPRKAGTYFQNIPILSLEDVADQLYDSVVAITTEKYADEIKRVLYRHMPEHRIYCTSMYPLGAVRGESVLWCGQYLRQNRDKLTEVYTLLEDEVSKETFHIVIDSWIRFQGDKLPGCMEEPQYFIPQIVKDMKNISCFIDVGAYIGDTISEAINYIPHIRRVYAFEADHSNYENLVRKYEKDHRVEAFRLAVSDRQGNAAFSRGYNFASGTTGHLCEQNGANKNSQLVPTVCLDHFTENIDVSDCFIKIDVEGSEMKVLKGSIEMIRRKRPKLAICVYHQNQDIIEIPLWLHNVMPDYKFFLRQHSVHGTDTVLYAV